MFWFSAWTPPHMAMRQCQCPNEMQFGLKALFSSLLDSSRWSFPRRSDTLLIINYLPTLLLKYLRKNLSSTVAPCNMKILNLWVLKIPEIKTAVTVKNEGDKMLAVWFINNTKKNFGFYFRSNNRFLFRKRLFRE